MLNTETTRLSSSSLHAFRASLYGVSTDARNDCLPGAPRKQDLLSNFKGVHIVRMLHTDFHFDSLSNSLIVTPMLKSWLGTRETAKILWPSEQLVRHVFRATLPGVSNAARA